MSIRFGKRFKEIRLSKGTSLREFCKANGFDPGNISRIERGLFPPPKSSEKLEEYANALGIPRGTDEWLEFFDLAAIEKGAIPSDILNDKEVVEKLPVLFRTMRAKAISADTMDQLVDLIRRS